MIRPEQDLGKGWSDAIDHEVLLRTRIFVTGMQ